MRLQNGNELEAFEKRIKANMVENRIKVRVSRR